MDYLAGVKIALVSVAVACIQIASSIEPSEAVWLLAFAGSLMGVVIGKDRTLRAMLFHSLLGLLVGVTASQIVISMAHIPQPATAMFCGLFATKATMWTANKIEDDGIAWLFPKWGSK